MRKSIVLSIAAMALFCDPFWLEHSNGQQPISGTEKESFEKPKEFDKRSDLNRGQLKFSFKKTAWKQVIEWFADEARLDLNMPTVPEGTITYSTIGEMTLLETMDVLNSFLMREQGYILIVHAKLIFVHDLNREIPPTMIDSVPSEKLNLLGEFELVQTEFDVKGINAQLFAEEIERFVRPEMGGKKVLFKSSHTLFVRETGGTLRSIQRYLDLAKKAEKQVVKQLDLKHVSPHEVLQIASKLIPLDEDLAYTNENDREKLKVVVHQAEDRFILSGTARSLDRFEEIVALIDKNPKRSIEESLPDVPIIRRYPIEADSDKILQVLRVVLSGKTGLRLDRAEDSGDIFAYATESIHQEIESVLTSLTTDKAVTEVITLNEYDPGEMIEVLNRRFGITNDSPPSGSTPVFDASTVHPADMIVTAKPAVLDKVKSMVLAIDPSPTDADGKFKKNFYHLKKSGPGADAAIEAVKSYFDLLQRPNKIFVYRKNIDRPGFKKYELNQQRQPDAVEENPKPQDPNREMLRSPEP